MMDSCTNKCYKNIGQDLFSIEKVTEKKKEQKVYVTRRGNSPKSNTGQSFGAKLVLFPSDVLRRVAQDRLTMFSEKKADNKKLRKMRKCSKYT